MRKVHLQYRNAVRVVALGLMICVVLMVAVGITRRPGRGAGPNLLVNGSMEDGFYSAYPNHYVANGWFRWWTDGSVLPEYADTSTRSNNVHYDGNRAQVYHKWAASYEAGIYQRVDVAPCAYYQLDVWARNHSVEEALPHARVGLDPEGIEFPRAVKDGLPPRTVWSREQTELNVWEQLTVTAEAVSNQVTAILYASPQPVRDQVHFYDTYWDAAALYEIPYPTTRLPAPATLGGSDFISNVTRRVEGSDLVVEWDTASPASSQVWYTTWTPAAPVSPTTEMTYTLYMPQIASSRPLMSLESETPVDTAPVSHHVARIPNVASGDHVEFAVHSRRAQDGVCVTEASATHTLVVP